MTMEEERLDQHDVDLAASEALGALARSQDLAGAQVAYRIRAELVCCHIYARVNDDKEMSLSVARGTRAWHDLCYWGEAAARLAETPRTWRADPDPCAQGCQPGSRCSHARAADELSRLGQEMDLELTTPRRRRGSKPPLTMVGPLTDVLYEIADGSNQKEIAANLNISYNLVRDYVARLYTILGSYDVMSTLRAGYVQGHLLMCPTCRRPSDRARRRQ